MRKVSLITYDLVTTVTLLSEAKTDEFKKANKRLKKRLHGITNLILTKKTIYHEKASHN